jgi:hypothetical protein
VLSLSIHFLQGVTNDYKIDINCLNSVNQINFNRGMKEHWGVAYHTVLYAIILILVMFNDNHRLTI